VWCSVQGILLCCIAAVGLCAWLLQPASQPEVPLLGGVRGSSLPAGMESGAAAGAAPAHHGVTVGISPAGLPYLLRVPAGCAAAPGASVPLVLFLHGAGESGPAPAWRLLPGYSPSAGAWLRGVPAPVRATPPGLAVDASPLAAGVGVLAPLTARGWGAPTQPAILALLDAVLSAHACLDPARVVLTGISMGGAGAWALGAAHAARFCGVAPICGYHQGNAAAIGAALARTPLYVAHAPNDVVVPHELSAELVAAARAAGNTHVQFLEAPGVAPAGGEGVMEGHDSWSAVFGSAAWWDWVRALPPRKQG
jgi:predicted esterase